MSKGLVGPLFIAVSVTCLTLPACQLGGGGGCTHARLAQGRLREQEIPVQLCALVRRLLLELERSLLL